MYKCDSPDELCLVTYCRYLGGMLLSKQGNESVIMVNGEKEKWIVQKELEFSSERKRMSVLACSPSLNRYVLFSKGADDMILARSRLRGTWNSLDLEANHATIVRTLQEYADKGLRTLVMAMRTLDESDFTDAVMKVEEASKAMERRDEVKSQWWKPWNRVMSSYETIEKQLIPLGVSGIEDLLQDDVESTIRVSG